jgi:hypothetical protein
MPIEIKEIIIRTRIEEQEPHREPIDYSRLKQEILQECLKWVKKDLRKHFEP